MTEMQLVDIRHHIAETCDFPAASDAIIEELGDIELSAPTGDTMTIAEILDIPEQTTYDSADALYTSIVGNLDDSFIGRKYYDDRGGARTVRDQYRGGNSF